MKLLLKFNLVQLAVFAGALDATSADIRAQVLSALEQQVRKDTIQLTPGWQLQVLPDPAKSAAGALVPAPIGPPAEATGASA